MKIFAKILPHHYLSDQDDTALCIFHSSLNLLSQIGFSQPLRDTINDQTNPFLNGTY